MWVPRIANTGLFYGGGGAQLFHQIIGVVVMGTFVFTASVFIFSVLKASMGLRVSEEEELRGLDTGEHGMESYSGFQFFITE